MSTRQCIGRLPNKHLLWIGIATSMVLLIPMVAMQFTQEVDWSFGDFAVMGSLLFGSGVLFVYLASFLVSRMRILLAFAVTLIVLYVWAELAVGIFTDLGS